MRQKVPAMTFKLALKTFMFQLRDCYETLDPEDERENKHGRLTLFAHGASSPSGTLAAELSTLVLAGAAVEARMRAAGIPRPVVGMGTAVGHGAGRRQRVGGDRRHGGGERRGVGDRRGRFTPAVEGSAGGARRPAGDEGGGCLRARVGGGGGGGSRRSDWCCGGGSCGE